MSLRGKARLIMIKTPPTQEERDMVKRLLAEATLDDRITEWEAEEFLPSLQSQTMWSEKQREVLDRIWSKIFD